MGLENQSAVPNLLKCAFVMAKWLRSAMSLVLGEPRFHRGRRCVDLRACLRKMLWPAVRQRLVAWSEREESNLAAFNGVLIQHFIRQFEKDPRDLSMIHYVSCLLDQKKILSETDLRAALDHCDSIADLHLSPDYVSK